MKSKLNLKYISIKSKVSLNNSSKLMQNKLNGFTTTKVFSISKIIREMDQRFRDIRINILTDKLILINK